MPWCTSGIAATWWCTIGSCEMLTSWRRALPAVLADGHLGRLARAGYDVFDPHLSARPGLLSARLAWHAAIGRY
jgi:hypothetical protein